jgi:hypothetical protein
MSLVEIHNRACRVQGVLSYLVLQRLHQRHLHKGTFREHSGNIQGTFKEHSGNSQGTLREHSGNIQGKFPHLSSYQSRPPSRALARSSRAYCCYETARDATGWTPSRRCMTRCRCCTRRGAGCRKRMTAGKPLKPTREHSVNIQ